MRASEHRARARAALKGKWLWAVLITLIASLLGGIVSSTGYDIELPTSDLESSFNTEFSGSDFEDFQDYDFSEVDPEILEYMDSIDFSDFGWEIPSVFWIIMVVVILVSLALGMAFSLFIGGPVAVGYRKYTIGLIDGAPVDIGTLFSQFSHMGRAVKLRLLLVAIELVPPLAALVVSGIGMALDLSAGLVLLILAMFVASIISIIVDYGLVLGEYILADDETCSAKDALRRSWELMEGNRWRYFCLGFSFIGWEILAGFTFGIGGLFLNPYIQTAYASFYRELVPAPAAPVAEEEAPVENFTYEALPDPAPVSQPVPEPLPEPAPDPDPESET